MDSLFGLEKVSAHDESLELLITVYEPTQKIVIESILCDAQIPYLVKERGVGSSMKILAGFSVFGTDIFVLRQHLETARQLITPADCPSEEGESTND